MLKETLASLVAIVAIHVSSAQPGGEPPADVTMKIETKPRTFLGVLVVQAQPALTVQLGLDEGVGLVVDHLDPDGPAAKAGIKRYDVLVKLDDQILIDPHQIGVLVRNKKPGQKTTISLIRSGKPDTVSVTLEEKAMPLRVGGPFGPVPMVEWIGEGGDRPFGVRVFGGEDAKGRLTMIQDTIRESTGHPMYKTMPHMFIESEDRQMLFTDEAGKVKVIINDGKPEVHVLDKDGNEVYKGPLHSEDDLNKVPEPFRDRVRMIRKIDARAPEGEELL